MRNSKSSLISDISFIAFLILLFICVIFVQMNADQSSMNLILIGLMFALVILTYFMSLTAGLIVCVTFDFIFLSIALYMSVTKGYVVPSYVYFWAVMLPLCSVCVSLISRSTAKLQKDLKACTTMVEDLTTLDELSGLKNLKAFMNDVPIYMHISRRYQHSLVLMVVGFRYQHEIEKIVGKDGMAQLIKHITKAILTAIRNEDILFMLDRSDITWGILMMTNEVNAMHIVTERIKEQINHLEIEGFRFQGINLEMRVGVQAFNENETEGALDLLNSAKHEMEYDVG